MTPNSLTISGQIFVFVAAILAAVGGLKYLVEPFFQRRRLRKVMATGLWLACYELRRHLESISNLLSGDILAAKSTRDALVKIPRNDSGGHADWFVKTGYYSMITAYKIAAFSSWMRIYQTTVLRALLIGRGSNLFVTDLFRKFDAYKVAASNGTILWYSYIDAIGEKLVTQDGDTIRPMEFSDFCMKYVDDKNFLLFFDQLHMFIHFMGKSGPGLPTNSSTALTPMVKCLRELEQFLVTSSDNLLIGYEPEDKRDRTASTKLADIKPTDGAPAAG